MGQFTVVTPPAHEPVSLNEVATYLKLDEAYDADLLARLVSSAREACELFTGQAMIHRDVSFEAVHQGTRFFLRGEPVAKLLETSWTLGTDETTLNVADLVRGIHAGRSYVELPHVPIGADVRVAYRLGMSADWNGVPETLRLGLLRLVAHQYENRSQPGIVALPGAVTALWQPYRQVRL